METEKHKKDRSSRHSKKSSKHRSREDTSSPPPVTPIDDSLSKRKHASDEESDDPKTGHSRSSNRGERVKKHRRDEEKSSSRRIEEPPVSSNNGASGGGASEELSIEETNKLREKIGLKPLTIVDSSKPVTETKSKTGEIKKTYIDPDTNQEFEHAPAKNMSDAKGQKTLRDKLREKREQRELNDKVLKSKGLGDSDEEESAAAWVEKVKQKQEAIKKAKLLEEMDEQFGVGEMIGERPKPTMVNNNYDSKHLRGMRVEHDQAMFKEGQDIILTLKDRNILQGTGESLDVDDDENADVLVNVNLVDDEGFNKNNENKKKKPGYQAYDEFDEEGLYKEKSILDKYNEELNGVNKKFFELDKGGAYDGSDQKFLEKLDAEHKAKAIRIDALNELRHETDYFTPTELEKFKKPKKVRRVLRKGKKDTILKADDLLPLPSVTTSKRVKRESDQIKSEPNQPKKDLGANKVSLKDIDFGLDKPTNESEASSDSNTSADESSDELALNQNELNDYQEMAENEANALDELQAILAKSRNRTTTKNSKHHDLDELIKVKQEAEDLIEETTSAAGVVSFDALNPMIVEEDTDHMYLDTMSEFCKNLGRNAKEEKSEHAMDENEEEGSEEETTQMKVEAVKVETIEESEDVILLEDDTESPDKSLVKDEDEEFDLLEDEPALDRGLASFLNLCKNKGFIEAEKTKKGTRPKKEAIEAVKVTVEDKNHYDIDDKFGSRNRDRFCGPTSDFQEKSNYKPNVKLDYIDEKGHQMNEKEAFRYLSHKFHGKGSGKKKTEKQQNKYKEKDIMAKMSSVDTPLNTVAMLVEKQKRLQQPYVVLSTSKGKQQEQVTLHKR